MEMSAKVYELPESLKAELQEMFGSWVNFSDEIRYYDHDIGVLPSLVRPLLGKTVPAAVVKAMSEEDVIKLMRWAHKNDIPVVPRASATSGYGGVIPTRGGVVLDLTSLHRIIEVDREAQTATVEPAIVWEDLERKLKPYGLAPRQVPSSAPASTVGGWFAQGGAGYGSFAYGWFSESVVQARVVLPNGEVRELEGEELKNFYGSMGSLGVVTRITIRLREDEPLHPAAYSFNDARKLSAAIKEISAQNLRLYAVNFVNPAGARLKNRVPAKTHHGHPLPKGPALPEEYVMLVAAFESDLEVLEKVKEIVEKAGGKTLESEVANHEWEERYNPMKIKRLGPSLVPAEVVVPLNSLYLVLSELEHKISLDFLLEGIGVKGNEIVLLGMIPHDERKFTFNFAYGLSLTVLKTALKYGGRPYAAGLYFGSYAERVFGVKKMNELKRLKSELDPAGIMNPEKLEGKKTLSGFISLASSFEPLVRTLGNSARIELKERFFSARDLPEDVAWYAYACAQCGYCVKECDQYYGRGWESQSPRGKWYWLKRYIEGKEELTQEQVDKFLVCTTCEMCSFRCQIDMPVEESWEKLRGKFVHEKDYMTFPPFEIMGASLRNERNIWANYADRRDAWVPDEIRAKIKDSAPIAYFAGCTASFVENDIGIAAMTLLDKAGVEFTYLGKDEACCGIPMLVAGKWDIFEEIMQHNISKMKEKGVETVVTSCPACYLVWAQYYPE